MASKRKTKVPKKEVFPFFDYSITQLLENKQKVTRTIIQRVNELLFRKTPNDLKH